MPPAQSHDLSNFIFSPEFLVGTIIAGLLINLVSNLIWGGLRRCFDWIWAKISIKYRMILDAEEHKLNETLAELAKNPQAETNIRFDILYFHIRMIEGLLLVIASLITGIFGINGASDKFSHIITGICMMVGTSFGLYLMQRYMKRRRNIYKIWRMLKHTNRLSI